MTATITPAQARRRPIRPDGGKVRAGRIIAVIIMIGCSAATALPLLLLLLNALKTNGQIIANPISLPTTPQFNNFSDAWKGGDFGAPLGRNFLNSVIVTAGTTVVVTIVGCLAGYALGAFRFRGSQFVTQGILIILAIPTQATIISIFDLMGQWNLRNSFVGLILVYSAFWMPFSVLLLRAAFRSFPKELTEAARVDGAGEMVTLFRVVIPIVKGPIAGVAIINGIGIWSELLFSYILMTEPDKQTLPSGIIAFTGAYVTDYRLLYAGLTISVIPVLLFYIFLSRMIRKGVSAGSLK